jgi:SAM-dependent methyltransferase
VLGYESIIGMDRMPGKAPMERIAITLLGTTYTQDVLNVDLNTDNHSYLEGEQYDKIFCFEVLEHLWYPMRALALFRRLLKPKGLLFLTVPNCASAMALRKMFAMQVPMVWNAFDDTIEKAHFREYTPLSLKYVLAHAAFEQLAFDTLYTASSVGDFHPAVQDLYPFPGQPELNTLLQGDTLFSIASPSGMPLEAYPDMLYNTGAYQESFYGEFPQTVSLGYYFSADYLRRNAPPQYPSPQSVDSPENSHTAEVTAPSIPFKARLKFALKALLALFPKPVQSVFRAVYHCIRRLRHRLQGCSGAVNS